MTDETVQTLALAGEIDLHTAPDVRRRGSRTLVTGDLVLDVSAVTFFDSAGIHLLLELNQAAAAHGHRIVLAAPPARVLKILLLTGTQDRFDVFSSVECATRSLRRHAPALALTS